MPIGQHNAAKTHCPNGHPYSDDNTTRTRKGRICKTCRNLKAANQRVHGKMIAYAALNKPCTDCKTKYPPHVMQFDHLPQYTKSFTIGQSYHFSPARILKEIDKCEVVCANCHADRTWQRSNG